MKSERVKWEFLLCNVELPKTIQLQDFSIVPLDDYHEKIKRLKQLSQKNISIETVRAKTTTPLTASEADEKVRILLSLLSFAQGRTITYSTKFSYSDSNDRIEHRVATVFGKSHGPIVITANELENFLKAGTVTLNESNRETDTLLQALYWYNLGFLGYSIQEFFIKRWIAFEIFVENYYLNKPKRIIPKKKFPREEIKEAIESILVDHKYDEKQIKRVLNAADRHLNRVDFMYKAKQFLFDDVGLPNIDLRKLDELYETRNNLFHQGFGSEEGIQEWTHGMLLENLVQRIILAKIDFRNAYFSGNFWRNPFTYAIGKP